MKRFKMLCNSFPVNAAVGGGGDSKQVRVDTCKSYNICYNGDTEHHNCNGVFMKRFGFTLAEVLITLGIIGIVAALTLPILIQKHQKKVTVNKLKKAYSELSQALVYAQNDNGPISGWNVYSLPANIDYTEDMLKYILPYYKGAKIKSNIYASDYLYKKTRRPTNFKGEYSGAAPLSRYWIETSDGMILSVGHVNWNNPVFYFQIDINGSSKPNIFGKDIFYFMIKSQKVLQGYNFSGLSREEILKSSCCKTCSGRGLSCATVIIQDGWDIKDDYPW